MQAGRLQKAIPQTITNAEVEVKADWPGSMRVFVNDKLVWQHKNGQRETDAEILQAVQAAAATA